MTLTILIPADRARIHTLSFDIFSLIDRSLHRECMVTNRSTEIFANVTRRKHEPVETIKLDLHKSHESKEVYKMFRRSRCVFLASLLTVATG